MTESSNEALLEIAKLKAECATLRGSCKRLGADLAKAVKASRRLERENGKLKAENKAQKEQNQTLFDSCDIMRGEELRALAEVEALRKDAEYGRLLSFCHGAGTEEMIRSNQELFAEVRRLKIFAGEPVPPLLEEFIGPYPEGPTARIRRKLAAMSKGEPSHE